MDWREYLDEATKDIDDYNEASETRRELLSHLTFLMDELIGQGIDEKLAYSEALRRMGNAEDVSGKFKAVHNPSKSQKIAQLYDSEMLWHDGNLTLRSLLKIEFKRALIKWQAGIAFVLIVAFFVQGYVSFQQYNQWIPVYNAYMAFIMAFDGPSAFLIGVLPLFVSIVAGDSLAWDRKSGFIQYVLTRTTFRKYILSKIVSSSALSFILVIVAELIAFLMALTLFPTSFSHQIVNGGTPHNLTWLYVKNPVLYVGLVALVAAMAAMVFAMASVVISTKVTNIYLVLAGPWLAYIVLSFVFQQTSLLRPFAPLTMLGQYIMLGNTGKGYVFDVPVIWGSTWLLGSIVTYVIFSQTFAHKGVKQ